MKLFLLTIFINISFSIDLSKFRAISHSDSTNKIPIKIGLVYQNYARSKTYDKIIRETIRNINTGQSVKLVRELPANYTLSVTDCILPKGIFFPHHVLNCICNTLIKEKVSVVIFLTTAESYSESTASAQYFIYMLSQTGIPIIAWNADNAGFTFNRPLSEYNLIQLAPPIQHQIKAMFAILKRYNWEKFAVIRSKMAGSERFFELIQERIRLERDDRSFKYEMMHSIEIDDSDDESTITNQLMELKKAQARIILLYSTMSKARKIFKLANYLGLLDPQYLWIGTQSVKGSLSSAHEGFQVGMLSINFHTISNAMFPPVDDVLLSVIDVSVKLFGIALQKSKFPPNTTFHSPITCESEDGYPGLNWDVGKKLYKNLLISFVKGNPYYAKDEFDNFFYRFDDQGMLLESQLIISNYRSKITSNGVVYTWEKVGEYKDTLRMADIEWPGKRANPPHGIAEKFHLRVAIQVAAFAIFFFEWVSPYSYNMGKYPPPGHRFSLCRSYWLVWATLFSASVSTDVPKSMVSRFFSLVWAAFGLTFLAVYTANLAAFMITRVQFHDLSGVDDYRLRYAADQSPEFTFSTVENGNTHENMKRNWRELNDFVTSRKLFVDNVSAGIDAVRKGKLQAFIYDAVPLDYLAGKDANCELIMVGKWASITGYGFGFPKNSPYIKEVNKFLMEYQKSGYLERIQNFWITGACQKDFNGQSQSAPLGIENFLSAFMLLGIGVIVGIGCLIFEYLYCSHLRRYVQRVDKKGWIGTISMALGKSLTFPEAVDRVKEWKIRNRSLSGSVSPNLIRKSIKRDDRIPENNDTIKESRL
uniref:PBPe domain-containing protein n=1 Tax=Strongyloides papillosus TaxID=174720 RepID=A0A0N5C5D9_STREA